MLLNLNKIVIKQLTAMADEKALAKNTHTLFVLPAEEPSELPFA